MNIPKLELKVIGFALAVSAVHLMIIAYSALKLGITLPSCLLDPADLSQPAVITQGDKHYEVHYRARMWFYQPNYLKIPTGSRVDFFLSAQDVLHGFYIAHTNVNMMAIPGTIADASYTFTKPGTYPIICHEFCGSGHQHMQGMIEVVDGLEEPAYTGVPEQVLGALQQEADPFTKLIPPVPAAG